jgi:hypothetical protein
MMRQGTANDIVAYGGPTFFVRRPSLYPRQKARDHDPMHRIVISSFVLSMTFRKTGAHPEGVRFRIMG